MPGQGMTTNPVMMAGEGMVGVGAKIGHSEIILSCPELKQIATTCEDLYSLAREDLERYK